MGKWRRAGAGLAGLWAVSVLTFSLQADETLNRLINDKKFDDAIKYADDKLPAVSRDATTWAQIAKANEALNLPEKALACYMVAWRLNPKDYTALVGAAKIYNKLDQPESALNYASKALEQNFTADASWEYARACIKLNRAADAKKALEKVIETDPENAIANRELGVIYFNAREYDKAVPLLRKAYMTQPDAGVARMLGKACMEANIMDCAMEYLKEAVTKNPQLYDANLDLARAYFKKDKFLAAANEYEKISGKIELTAMDNYNRALSHEKTGNADLALKAYIAAAEKFGASKELEALTSHVKAGMGLMDRKNFDAALPHFLSIASVDPEARTINNIYFLLADAYTGSGNQTKAIASLEKALSLDNKNIEAYARLADLYEKNGMGDKARQVYEKMMSLSPNDPHVYQVLGDYNLKSKKFGEALKYYEKAYVLEHSAKSAEGLAVSAAALNQWDKARDAAESAIKLDPSLMDARVVLAKSYMKEKNYRAAREPLEFILTKRGDLEYWKQLATCYANLGEQQRLAEVDKKISEMDKSNVESRLRLAQYALSQKDTRQAFGLYKELAQLSPQNAVVFKNLYEISLQSGDKNNAAMYQKKYLALNPNDAAGQKSLGDLLYELKDSDGALNAYRAALKLDPTLKGFFKRYAELVVAKGQQEEVIKVLSGAVNSGEADVGAYTTLGMIYQKKGQFAKALDMYQKAIQMDPQNADILASLAECQAKTGDVNSAIISYEQVIMMNPKADTEYRDLGNLYTSQNRVDQAIGVYRKYLDKVPSDQDVAKKVGMFLYGKKQYQDAIKYLEMVKEKGTYDNNFQLALGECYFNLNNLKKAQQVYEGIRTRNKANPSFNLKPVLKLLAEAYEKDNNSAQAVEVFTAYALLPGQKDLEAIYKAASLQEKINPLRARKIYEDNIVSFPNDYRSYLRLGIMYAKDKATLARSATLLKKASSIADTIPAMWLELAQVYGKLGNEREELAAYKKLVSMEPQNLEANKRLGIALMKSGVVPDAMVYLEMANTLSSKDPEILTMLAMGYIKTNRPKDAIDVLQKAKALKADDADVRMQLVDLYRKTGQDKKALEEMKQLIEIKRDNKIMIMYAQGLVTDGKYKDAEEIIENIKATDPENIEALMVLGDAQRLDKKLDPAIETYKEISYIKPDYAPALYQRAEVHMLQNKYQWAKTFYERALRADPKSALAELGLAKVAKATKNQDAYMEHLDKAMKIDPNNDEIKEEYKKAKK